MVTTTITFVAVITQPMAVLLTHHHRHCLFSHRNHSSTLEISSRLAFLWFFVYPKLYFFFFFLSLELSCLSVVFFVVVLGVNERVFFFLKPW